MLIKVDSVSERYILSGRVQLRQGNTIFYCDSAVKDERTNLVEAFGNIHINDGDTVHTYDLLRPGYLQKPHCC